MADLGDFVRRHPARYTADDFEPDGQFYSMIAVRGVLYAMEANHGQLVAVIPGRSIRQAADISAAEGHIVRTSLAEWNGSFYVGNLGLFPIRPQAARILTLSRAGRDDDVPPGFDSDPRGFRVAGSKAGFTTVVATDFGPDGLFYALELSAQAGLPTPGAGKVVRVKRSGEIEDVVTGLSLPTGMTFGPGRSYALIFLGAGSGSAG